MSKELERLKLICEETETGVVEGCNPSPWAPCVYPSGNYQSRYSVVRRWYGDECQCQEKEDDGGPDMMAGNVDENGEDVT